VKLIESKKPTHVELLDSLIKQRTSITTLNSDSHSKSFIVKDTRRIAIETLGSCGIVPAPKSGSSAAVSQLRSSSFPNAGRGPAFSLRARRPLPELLRSAEFISVSGLRADRSALHSDMRPSKRTSGFAAATARPHAPMNSSSGAHYGHFGFAHQPFFHTVRR
jgi:hypothetical protein